MSVVSVKELPLALDGRPTPDHALAARQIVTGLGQLATLPTVTLQIMRLADDPHATGDALDRLLVADPTLGARVLRVVNSAFYGLPGTVTTTGAAIVRLGFAAIRNIAIAASLTRMFRGGRLTLTFDAKDVWRHSVAVAEAARWLARRSKRGSADEALLAGLLHDIGIVVAMQGCRPQFEQLLNALEFNDEAVYADAEREALGTTHALLGAELSRRWGFPATLASVAEHHHTPMVLDVSVRTLPALVHVADHLAVRAGEGYTRTVGGETLDSAVVAWLGLKDADLEELLTLLPAATSEAMQVLGDGN